jgi:hypothetical protein
MPSEIRSATTTAPSSPRRDNPLEGVHPAYFPFVEAASVGGLFDIKASVQRRLLADIVAKVFLGRRTKILRAAHAFYARRREGPYRFIQNRSRISVVALKSDAVAEKPKDQLSRDFLGCSIFDFCNNIGTKRTWPDVRLESAFGGKAEVEFRGRQVR